MAKNEQNKSTTHSGRLIILVLLIMFGVAYISSLFSPKNSITSTSAYAESRWPEIGELVKLKGGYPFGATKELFDKASDMLVAKDKEAFIQLMMTGLVGLTKEGDEAYYEGMEGGGWLPSGIVKIRFKGSIETYYTNSEAVGIK